MGTNIFRAFPTIPAGSGSIVTGTVVASDLDPNFTFLLNCAGDAPIGTIAIEGSADGGITFDVVGQFTLGNDSDPNRDEGNPRPFVLIPPPLIVGARPVQFLRAKVMPGTLIRSDITITLGAEANCDCDTNVDAFGVSTMGNTAGITGTAQGTIVLVGSQAITLSQSKDAGGATITIDALQNALGVSNLGNTVGDTGTTVGTVVLQGIAGATLSQVTAPGNQATIVISVQTNTNTGASGIGLSAGTTSATSGVVVFSNSNGVTFGMAGNTVTASISREPSIAAGTQTGSSGTVVFSNSNNVTFGMTNSSIVTASANSLAVAAGTQTATSGTAVFSNSNGVTFGMNGSSVVTASVLGAQVIAAGTQSNSSGTLVFSNSNNVTFGMSGNSIITASANSLAVGAGTQTATSGTVVLADSNGVTFGMAGSSQITVSVNSLAVGAGTQTATSGTAIFSNSNNITFGMSNSSVITASFGGPQVAVGAGTQTITSGTVIFSNSNNVTFGMSNGSVITASANVLAVAAGTQTAVTGTAIFSNGNGVSFGMAGSATVTASHNAVSQLAVGDAATGTQVNLGVPRLEFDTGNNVIFGKNVVGGTFVVTAQAQAVAVGAGTQTATSGTVIFSNSGNVTFGMSNGSVITASAGPAAAQVSFWENAPAENLNATILGDIQLFLQRLHFAVGISATRANMIVQALNASTNAGATLTMRFGVYTMNGSTASLASSASRTWGYNSTATASVYSLASGFRYRSISLPTWNLTPGDYYFGVVVSISESGNGGDYSWKCRRNLPLAGPEFNNTAFTQPYFGHGSFSAVTGNLRNSIQISEVSQCNADDLNDFPWFSLQGTF